MPDVSTKTGRGFQHWCTPPEVVGYVHQMFQDRPDLDPFSNPDSVTEAHVEWFGRAFDEDEYCGWSSWPTHLKNVFVNPPWSKTQRAILKCEDEWLRVPGRQVIGLFPAGPNSRGWPTVIRAPAKCFPSERVKFLRAGVQSETGATKNVVIVYWGHDPYRFRAVFRDLGEVLMG